MDFGYFDGVASRHNAYDRLTTLQDAVKGINTLAATTTLQDAVKGIDTLAAMTTLQDAIKAPGFASYYEAVHVAVHRAADVMDCGASSAQPDIDDLAGVLQDLRRTKKQTRGSLDLVTFLIALVWFGFALSEVPVPEQVKVGVEALLALAVVLSRRTH